MTSTFPRRVAFEDHRLMRAIDLEDEQLYHLQRRWQHNLALHTWGILCGLEVRINGQRQQQPNVVIHPGMALDGYGRELIVTDNLAVLESEPYFDPAVTYDVWLSYSVGIDASADPVDDCIPPGKDRCYFPPDTNLRRIVERPEVLVRRTSQRQSGSVTQPREVPLGDLFFSPDRPMKFEASSKWPVFLCKLECMGSTWTVDQTERHYGGLIAERIEMPFQTAEKADPPSRQTAILNGGHPERPEWRFAVLDIPVPKKDEPPKPPDPSRALPDDVPAPLSIRSVSHFNGKETTTESEIRWQAERVVAEADLVMRGGAGIQFETTPAGEKPIAPTSEWGIYRQFRPAASNPVASAQSQQTEAQTNTSDSSDKQYKDANTDQFSDVLQISMPARDQGMNSVAIGAVTADGKFSPVLVVNNDQSVDIFGMLRVHGTIYGDTTDLPPIDTDKVHEFFREWLKKQVLSGNPEGKSFVKLIMESADPTILRDGFGAVEDQREKALYTLLAPQIINLMPANLAGNAFAAEFAGAIAADDGPNNDFAEQKNFYKTLAPQIINLMPANPAGDAFATEFAGAIAADDGPNNDFAEQKNFYKTLAPQIINLMPADTVGDAFTTAFVAAINGAAEAKQRTLYTALAKQIVGLMPNNTAGDAFATAFAAEIKVTAKAKQRNLYIALAEQIVELMPSDHQGNAFARAFADAISAAADDAESNLYNKLAKPMVELMAATAPAAETFANKLVGPNVTLLQKKNFCQAMLKPAEKLLSATEVVTALAADATKWNPILDALWDDPTHATALGARLTLHQTNMQNFVQGLSAPAQTALKALLP